MGEGPKPSLGSLKVTVGVKEEAVDLSRCWVTFVRLKQHRKNMLQGLDCASCPSLCFLGTQSRRSSVTDEDNSWSVDDLGREVEL